MAVKAPRSKVVHIRLTEAEHAHLGAFCAEHSLTQSEVLRCMARQAAGFGPTFSGEPRAAIFELSRQLRAIGVNINQAARAMNSGRVPSHAELQKSFGLLVRLLEDQDELYRSLCFNARSRASAAMDVA